MGFRSVDVIESTWAAAALAFAAWGGALLHPVFRHSIWLVHLIQVSLSVAASPARLFWAFVALGVDGASIVDDVMAHGTDVTDGAVSTHQTTVTMVELVLLVAGFFLSVIRVQLYHGQIDLPASPAEKGPVRLPPPGADLHRLLV